MKIDLLSAIYQGELSEDGAYDLYNGFKDLEGVDQDQTWVEYFGFDRYEATAFAHGASLSDLVSFRYTGWPTICSCCSKPLNYQEFYWRYIWDENNGPQLKHLICPV